MILAIDPDGNAGVLCHIPRLWRTIPNRRPLPPHHAEPREFGATNARRMTKTAATDDRP